MYDALVVGNGLAGLISARELTRRGKSVALLSDGRMPGGHFNGIKCAGVRYIRGDDRDICPEEAGRRRSSTDGRGTGLRDVEYTSTST